MAPKKRDAKSDSQNIFASNQPLKRQHLLLQKSRSAGAKENAGGKLCSQRHVFFDISFDPQFGIAGSPSKRFRLNPTVLSSEVFHPTWLSSRGLHVISFFGAKAQGSRTAIDLDEVRFTVRGLFQ